MSPHQAKRPYAGSQPSITSYFPPTSPTSQSNYSITPQAFSDSTPTLPANVQSNLLSVGMRVRKSVPEGYKTGSYSAFTLFSDNPSTSEVGSLHREGGMRPRARELAPFCGINKVGGMAQQGWDDYDRFTAPYGEEDLDFDDENETPVLSQGSTVSNASVASYGGALKRRYDLDEGEDEGKTLYGLGGRPIAVPRRMKKGLDAVTVVGQENIGDFEDAEFLDYGLLSSDEIMGGV